MNAFRLIELLDKYKECPVCKSSKVGNGYGFISCGEKVFDRGCKCGWQIQVLENGTIIKEKGRKGGEKL